MLANIAQELSLPLERHGRQQDQWLSKVDNLEVLNSTTQYMSRRCSVSYVPSWNGVSTSSACTSTFTQIKKLSKTLTHRKTFPCDKPIGWNIFHSMNTQSLTSKERTILLLMLFQECQSLKPNPFLSLQYFPSKMTWNYSQKFRRDMQGYLVCEHPWRHQAWGHGQQTRHQTRKWAPFHWLMPHNSKVSQPLQIPLASCTWPSGAFWGGEVLCFTTKWILLAKHEEGPLVCLCTHVHSMSAKQITNSQDTWPFTPPANPWLSFQLHCNHLHWSASPRWWFQWNHYHDGLPQSGHPTCSLHNQHHCRTIHKHLLWQMVLREWLPPQNHKQPWQIICLKILESVDEVNRYQTQTLHSVSP